MATVHYETGFQDRFDESEDGMRHPFAVADSGISDAIRAEADFRAEIAPSPLKSRPTVRQQKRFHRLAEVRQQQGVTLRNVARRLGVEISVVRRQEQEDCDVRISDLLGWQEVLEVPIAELLVEADSQLSGPVLERSRMVKLMKTAAAIREQTDGTATHRLANMLIGQILEIMPELQDVSPWHHAGQRRTLDDVGRAARNVVPDDVFGNSAS
jgi:transcriptional regulator with XRE-family HTH domain